MLLLTIIILSHQITSHHITPHHITPHFYRTPSQHHMTPNHTTPHQISSLVDTSSKILLQGNQTRSDPYHTSTAFVITIFIMTYYPHPHPPPRPSRPSCQWPPELPYCRGVCSGQWRHQDWLVSVHVFFSVLMISLPVSQLFNPHLHFCNTTTLQSVTPINMYLPPHTHTHTLTCACVCDLCL